MSIATRHREHPVGKEMILIGLGANLPSPDHGPPKATLEAALAALEERGVRVCRRSRWYSSAPVPPSDQPRFVNAVVAVETALSPEALLAALHAVERAFGRRRTVSNAARPIDLDLLAYGAQVRTDAAPILPHPRLAERAFVVLPLCDVAPDWRHPILHKTARELAVVLPGDADVAPCIGSDEPAK